MNLTPEQADTNLRTAIVEHAMAYGIHEEGEMLSEYAIVAAWEPPLEDDVTRYTTHFHKRQVPTHVSAGLFAIGEALAMDLHDGEYDEGDFD